MNNYPYVSILIVMRNEEKYIEKCIESVINQKYPKDKFEIIVVDGQSTDGSLNIVKKYLKNNNIKIIENNKKTLASGWNIGIKESKGEIVIRPDAHSYIEKDFIIKNIKTLQENKDTICVGGKIETISLGGSIADAITSVLSSPFGVGNSYFRIGSEAKYVDTVAYGAYRKEIFDKVGYFNENLERNQDLEMHSRIKKSGEKFYFNPDIKSYYFTRVTVSGMAKQAFRNGKWNMITLNWQKDALSFRHLIPLIFVLSIIFNILVSTIYYEWIWLLMFEIIVYILGALIATISIAVKSFSYNIFLIPFLFLVLHTSYGIGSMFGIIDLFKIKLKKYYN